MEKERTVEMFGKERSWFSEAGVEKRRQYMDIVNCLARTWAAKNIFVKNTVLAYL